MHYDLPFFDATHRQLTLILLHGVRTSLPTDEPEDVDTRCRQLVRLLGDAGWLRYCVPETAGGALPPRLTRPLYHS